MIIDAISQETADHFRYIYATLAMVACAGFVTTLIVRWDLLHPGEKILRIGLVLEHAVITYAAYVALSLDFPPTEVGILLTLSLIIVITGFAVWLADIIVHGDDGPRRLSRQGHLQRRGAFTGVTWQRTRAPDATHKDET